jgi:RNA recognition motif-containing protein
MSKRLYVGNLPFDCTELELRGLFEQFGTVTDTKVVLDRETGRSRGFGFVEMSTDQEATNAVAGSNGREMNGRTLRVNEAQEKSSGGRTNGRTARW